MTIRRFYVEPESFTNNNIIITGDEFNHLKNVLRLTKGTQIIVVCNDEFDYYANIVEITKNSAICEIVNKELNINNPKTNVSVYQALTKKDAMSNLVQRLSELGINNFIPLETKNTTAKDKVNKIEKLQVVANQSAKQCKRSKVLSVKNTINFKNLLTELKNYDLVIFANETEKENNIINLFNNNNTYNNVAIIVGSEGGFSPEEIDLLINNNCKSITLGKRILRVETATIALSAIVLNYLNELN